MRVRQNRYSRVWVIFWEGEEKGAHANIVTVGCGGYCLRAKKKVRTPTYLQSGVDDIVGV